MTSLVDDRVIHLPIMASLRERKTIPIDFSDSDDEDDDLIWTFMPKKKSGASSLSYEKGASSGDPPFVCEICTETKTPKDSFRITGCSHSYCAECMTMYVSSKLQENIINIPCPESECRGLLELLNCRPILPSQVFDRWSDALCEAVILGSEKFYCPFKDCSALLIDDGKEVVKESECPNCRRLFCAQCKVAWHNGIECAEFQKLNKDEKEKEGIMLMHLAKDKQWRRCPTCMFYIEKSSGCMYMKCRCGTAFCYNCGTLAKGSSHHCSNCGC